MLGIQISAAIPATTTVTPVLAFIHKRKETTKSIAMALAMNVNITELLLCPFVTAAGPLSTRILLEEASDGQ